MFGAILMEELDSVCAVFAAEICDTPWIVTKTMNIEFITPVLPNQIYKTYVGIKKIGKTSITLVAEIRKHSVHTENGTVALKADIVEGTKYKFKNGKVLTYLGKFKTFSY